MLNEWMDVYVGEHWSIDRYTISIKGDTLVEEGDEEVVEVKTVKKKEKRTKGLNSSQF